MPSPRFEELIGTTDGVNVIFTAPSAYIPGTLTLWIRGLPRPLANDDGGTELDPSAGTVTLNEAPLADDSVAAFYLEPTAGTAEHVEELEGSIDFGEVVGTVEEMVEISGMILASHIAGEVREVVLLEGTIEPIQIAGTIEVCP